MTRPKYCHFALSLIVLTFVVISPLYTQTEENPDTEASENVIVETGFEQNSTREFDNSSVARQNRMDDQNAQRKAASEISASSEVINTSSGLNTTHDILSTGSYRILDAADYNIPDDGMRYVILEPDVSIPPNAKVTNVEYDLRIDDLGDANNFWCVDYGVFLSSEENIVPRMFHNVYNHLGGKTDGGYDDDAADDSDIYLYNRSTSVFNGEPADQKWSIWINDKYSGSPGYEGVGKLDWIGFDIYWESKNGPNTITVTSPNGGETLAIGETYNITWSANPMIGDLAIALSTNNGDTWWRFPDGVGEFYPNTGSFEFTPVIENQSDQCLIKVMSAANYSVVDQSDAVFSISDQALPSVINVTLQANTATLGDTLQPHHFLQVRGMVNDQTGNVLADGKKISWDEFSELVMQNKGGDYWEVTFQLNKGDQLQYKYWAGFSPTEPTNLNGWEADINAIDGIGAQNRSFVAGKSDTTLPLEYYNGSNTRQDQYWKPFEHLEDHIAVYFRVNMAGVIKTNRYDPALNYPVGIRGTAETSGNVLSWFSTNFQFATEEDSRDAAFRSGVIYFPTASVGTGSIQEYKFFIDNEPAGGWEFSIPNRTFLYTPSLIYIRKDTTLHWVYFDDKDPNTVNADPILLVTPTALDFGVTQLTLDLAISNSGEGTLNWNISENPDKPWITSITPNSGVNDARITVTVDRAQLSGNSDTGTLKVTSDGGEQDVTVSIAKAPTELPEDWTFTPMTGNSATVVLPTSSNPNIKGDPLQNGDYIGVFTDAGLCCGHRQWQGANLSITIWGDDTQSPETDGFQSGENLNYRIYRLSENMEWRDVVTEYSQGDGTYESNSFQVLSKFEVNEAGSLPDHWTITPQTGNYATIVLPTDINPTVDGTPLQNGDFIGAFTPANLCCGLKEWQGANAAITVWGDNDQTTEIDGIRSGEEVAFRVYRLSEDREWSNITTAYSQGNGVYDANAFMVLSQFETATINVQHELPAPIPESYRLYQNYPNPFNPETTIRFELPVEASVKLNVFDVNGKVMNVLANGNYTAGSHTASWNGVKADGQKAASGIYFYQLQADPINNSSASFSVVKKMILVK